MASDGAGTGTRTLLSRIRRGDSRALGRLVRQQGDDLRRWARGRLPAWARRATDTMDLVQETLFRTIQRIDRFKHRGRGSLQAYLRQAIRHRITDEMRRIVRQKTEPIGDDAQRLPWDGQSPLEASMEEDLGRRYKRALAKLTEGERVLVVGRLELEYSYQQLALATDRTTAGAARIAVRRAVEKLAHFMANE